MLLWVSPISKLSISVILICISRMVNSRIPCFFWSFFIVLAVTNGSRILYLSISRTHRAHCIHFFVSNSCEQYEIAGQVFHIFRWVFRSFVLNFEMEYLCLISTNFRIRKKIKLINYIQVCGLLISCKSNLKFWENSTTLSDFVCY